MIHKIIAVMLTVLITVSTFSAYGTVLSGCSDQSCCCAAMALTPKMEAGQTEKVLNIESARGCCCGDDTVSNCSLTMIVPLVKIGWALSSNRIEPSFSSPLIIASPVDADNYTQITFRSRITSDKPHPGAPPIYLVSMSFLC